MSYAPTLRAVRAQFGLRQHALADWLGLSRSQYGLVEADLNPLPGHAQPWLAPWMQALLLPDPAPPVPPVPLTPLPPLAGPEALRGRLQDCWLEAERLGRRLAAEQARNHALRRRLAAGPVLAAALPPDPTADTTDTARRRRWLARLLEEATDALLPIRANAGPTAEALLAARHHACCQEAAWLEAYLTAGPA